MIPIHEQTLFPSMLFDCKWVGPDALLQMPSSEVPGSSNINITVLNYLSALSANSHSDRPRHLCPTRANFGQSNFGLCKSSSNLHLTSHSRTKFGQIYIEKNSRLSHIDPKRSTSFVSGTSSEAIEDYLIEFGHHLA
jgi:hypothetical protein